MLFDYCISNPAFNIAETNNKAGTGGNTSLYKTTTRYDFKNRLKCGGTLINITLKGIIPDLLHGNFANNQINWIHLMDDIHVWDYNTCIFSITKKNKKNQPIIKGGFCKNIFTIDDRENFDMVYYSMSDNSINSHFNKSFNNKVIRKLPGKNRPEVIYDYTYKKIDNGPKLAFTVLESKKSYTVTDEPIYGGGIAYINCDSLDEATRLKNFLLNNTIYNEYVKRMKLRDYAFGLRNVKKFDLSQIVSGVEIPKEWNYKSNEVTIFENDIISNKNTIKLMGEVFTPNSLVEFILDQLEYNDNQAFSNQNKTFIDSMCGNGQFVLGIIKRKIKRGISPQNAIDCVYGYDLSDSNINQCKQRIFDLTGLESKNIQQKNSLLRDKTTYHLSSFTD